MEDLCLLVKCFGNTSVKYCLSVSVAVLWSESHCVSEVLLELSLFCMVENTVIVAGGSQPSSKRHPVPCHWNYPPFIHVNKILLVLSWPAARTFLLNTKRTLQKMIFWFAMSPRLFQTHLVSSSSS